MVTPAALPCTIWLTLETTPTFAALPSIVETDPVMASRRWVPYPVTTTASRIAAADDDGVEVVSIVLEKGRRDRAGEEELVARAAILALAGGCGVDGTPAV